MRRLLPPVLTLLLLLEAVPAHAAGPAAWSGDAAIAAMRSRLRTRGYGPEVTGGPMAAIWVDGAPLPPLRSDPAIPAAARRVDNGAWLVATEGGGWWVWEFADVGPVDEPLPMLE